MNNRESLDHSAILLLADGTVFRGRAAGSVGTATGEIAFNTSMTGYQEIFTDPSYFGQIVVMASVHIGNYGVKKDEMESSGFKISGLVVKKFSDIHSRLGSSGDLGSALDKAGVVGISDIDTRKLVRHIRKNGAMNALISSDVEDLDLLKFKLQSVPSMYGLELASKLSTAEIYTEFVPNCQATVALIDYGVKQSIVRSLKESGASVIVFPHNSGLDSILAFKPDGILLSNGPGDPSSMPEAIETVRQLLKTGIPLFGICLGHQILALSVGLKTEKMHNGHRGVNHPVKNLETGRCEITSQNHGFVISTDSVVESDVATITHVHLNDGSVAGIKLNHFKAFSVQYHPEASAGPHDSRYLFDQFISMMAREPTLID